MVLSKLRRDRRQGAGWLQVQPGETADREVVNTQETPQEAADRLGTVLRGINEYVPQRRIYNLADGTSTMVNARDLGFYLDMLVYRCSVHSCTWTSVRQGQHQAHHTLVDGLRRMHQNAQPSLVGGEHSYFQCSGCGSQNISPVKVQRHIDGARMQKAHEGATEWIGKLYDLTPLPVAVPVVQANGRQPVSAPVVGSGVVPLQRHRRHRSRGRRHASSR